MIKPQKGCKNCGHPQNEHLEDWSACRHYTDPTTHAIALYGENASGTYCTCEKFEDEN